MVWEHELPLEIEYNQDRGFFHSFGGDVGRSTVPLSRDSSLLISFMTSQNSQVAFVFASEVEANDFYKKVSKRGKYLRGEFRSCRLASNIRLISI